MNNDIAIENFIDFCDEMIIAEESFREGNSIIDKSLNKLQQMSEKFKQIVYKHGANSSKDQYVLVPKVVDDELQDLHKTMLKFFNNDILRLTDRTIDLMTQDVDKTLALAKNYKYNCATEKIMRVRLNDVYKNLNSASTRISEMIRDAEKFKKQKGENPDVVKG